MSRRKRWKRFPRLHNAAQCIAISKILIHTYNNLAISRVEEKKKFRMKYDIIEKEMERGREDVEKHFLMMSVLLREEKIDPLLYLQIMSKYGRFRHTSYLPRPNQLASPKSIETFKWLIKKERAKWLLDSDWRRFLNGTLASSLDRSRIASEIKASWKFLETPLKRTELGLDVGLASIALSDHLSSWFLAICKPFLRLYGLDLLADYKRKEVRSCMAALMRDRSLLKTAVKAYKKHLV